MNGTDADIVTALVDGISRLLAGHDPATQGVALADCLATWLAGHHVAGEEGATRLLRAQIFAHHCMVVRQLVPLAEVAAPGTGAQAVKPRDRDSSGDRPAAEPGGMECEECGRIFIGAEWHALCAVCFRLHAEAGSAR